MPEPTHAIVIDAIITSLALMDSATADQFRTLGFVEQMWPGGALVDVTDLEPRPAIGWSYDGNAFTPPAADPDPGLGPIEA